MENLRLQMVDVCQRLAQRGLVANHDGNVSIRLPDGRFLATPTSFAKSDVTAADILLLDQKGSVVEGKHKVFSEMAWHRAIYSVRPDVTCVVHGHPTVAGGFGLAGKEIGVPALPEAIVSLGRHILTTAFLSPFGNNFEMEFSRVLKESDACLVPGNGAWAVGQSVLQTYLRLELVEHVAKQHQVAESLGGVKPLPGFLVEELLKKRPLPKAPSKFDNLKEIVRSELQSILRQ